MYFCTQQPCLVAFWFRSSSTQDLSRLVVLSSLVSFLFGWHVHEKAICIVLIPFGLFFATKSPTEFKTFALLSLAGNYSLFPLIFTKNEYLIKTCICIGYLAAIVIVAKWNHIEKPFGNKLLTSFVITCFVLIEIFPLVAPNLSHRLPFLQLMLTSVTTAIVILSTSMHLFFSLISFPSSKLHQSAPMTKKSKKE